MKTARRIALALTVVLGVTRPAWAHGEDDRPQGKAPEQLGEVSFPVTCNAAAQTEFNRAMALFHSFWFDPAKASFAKVLEHDPECGMAHWGIAIVAMGNPFTWPSNPNAAKAGAPAAAEAQRVGARSQRERDYIAALSLFFKDWQTTEFRPRALAFEKAMESVAAKYRQDEFAAIPARFALERGDWKQAAAFAEQRNDEAVQLMRAAAEASGNRQAAADYYAKLQALAADRDTERPELTQAKTFLARLSPRSWLTRGVLGGCRSSAVAPEI